MAENRSFWRAIEAIGRGVLAPISLLAMTCLLIVLAPSSDNENASATAFLTRTFSNAGTTQAAGTTVNSSGTLGTTPTLTSGRYSWTVPATGRYRILAEGAAGGTNTSTVYVGGLGASVTAEWNLTAGQVLTIVVGHQGVSNSNAGGGGGATGVVAPSGSPATLLAVAGGGGGGGWSYHGNGGVTTTSGQNSGNMAGGTNGAGGQAGFFSGDCGIGGGGGGYSGNGSSTNGNGSTPSANNTLGGVSYANGGTGSISATCGDGGNGGFGFAGGGKGNYGGGGGGGYSGGAGGQYRYGQAPASGGGGGGSFVDAAALTSSLTAASRSGHGNVVITLLAPAPTTFASQTASPTNVSTLNYDVVFSESVTGLTTSDFTVSGTSSGWVVSSLSGSGTTYVLTVSSSAQSTGTVIVTMLQNAVLGSSSSQNGPGGNTAAPTMNIDIDAPTASFSSTPSTPASAMSLTFGVSFSESVSGIAAADFSNAGTAQGCVYTPSATSGTSVNVVVTQCQEGTLQLQFASGGVVDTAGNTGPTSALQSTVITLAASALSVTASSQTVNYGGSWTDSYSQSGLIGSDTLTITYTYSGTTNDGSSYGPSSTKPTSGGSYTIIPAVAYGGANANRYSLTRTNGALIINRISQSALTVSSTSATYGSNLTLTSSGGTGTGAVTWQVMSGTCTVSGSTLTPGDAGSACVVRATKAQDTNYLAVNSANTTVSIGRASQSGFFISNISSFVTGSNLSVTATGGQSGGSISWSVASGICVLSGTTLTSSRGGVSCTIEATRAGNSNYLSTSDSMSITVDKIVQSLTFQSTPPSSPLVGGTYTVSVTSDASLAPTLSIANSSSSVCSISAGVVSFQSPGSCLITASQAGNDQYAPAAASQQISVTAVPTTTTVPVTTPGSGTTPVAGAPSTSVAPSAGATSNQSSSTTSTTTTTTTTTVPNNSTGQGDTEVAAGEATAVVRGKRVKVNVETVNGQLVFRLPNNVTVQVGAPKGSTSSAAVNSDGVLVAQTRDEVAIGATGFEAGTTYTVTMFSTPVELGRGNVAPSGAVSDTVTIPNKAKAGTHTLVIEGVGPNAEVVAVSMGFKVLERSNNTWAAIVAIVLAIGLALLSGRPILRRRRKAA